ncbi:exo 1,3/1,4-beta-D-glucan glucohydrolase [Luteitalea sp. TBR-22]|uniref:glycoside hydrolase family 3 protein n=1 Tax=Luteitalea sp. TBR-22 TaxID=2802971 RepID=UPI00351D1CB7
MLATVSARQQGGVANPERWPVAKSPGVLTDAATEARVSALLAGLSVEEKVGQVIQADLSAIKPEDLKTYPLGSVQAGGNSSPNGDERAPASVWVEAMRQFRAANKAYWGSRPVIPIMFGIDAVHGHANMVGATIVPHNVGLGAMRDPALVRRIGEMTAREMAATGADWTYAPTVTVPRDDRWGRGYEGWSEDPEIVAAYARAITLGLQGELGVDPIAPGHIAGTAKHFLADGGTDGGKDQGDARISEEELVRVHAAGYKPAIDAGILTVMMSFSSWNGVKHTGNRSLITDVLKGRMGFTGLVINDWNSHGQVPGCTNDNCPQAINAGVDMYMVPSDWKGLYANLVRQVKDGTVPMARLDDAVRRILRVKIKAGLFRSDRPLEGRLELLGAPEHRAIAREAVRKSLVLLKNDGVLPIRGNARVLVAGDADDIGKACGGWTLSWQGTGNTNKDFPGAQSILAGLRDALGAQGGSVTYSADGRVTTRPDVAVVVFGEEPYAEFQGDLATMHYKPGDDRDLSVLRTLKAQGIPTVAVFLSGRPLWVNREINASDAFVAAWLPGTEGGGIADVLVGDAAGRPRFDFTGTLARTWPKRPDQATLNRGDAGADPLFAYGYGLSYARPAAVGRLPEDGAVSESTAGDVFFGAGRMQGGARAILRDSAGERHVPVEGAAESPARVVVMSPRDVGAQENAREVTWSGAAAGTLEFTGITRDLSRQANGDMAIAFTWAVEEAPTAAVTLGMGCGDGCLGRVDVTSQLRASAPGQLRSLKVKLSCLAAQGAVMRRIDRPVVLETTGRLRVVLREVRLVTNEGDAICPGR